nr:hypothetical protein [Xylella fastidiosa]
MGHGRSVEMLNEQNEVSAASKVSVTGQADSCDLSSRIGPLLAGIEEVMDGLNSALDNFQVLDFSGFNADREVLCTWRDIVVRFLDVRDDLEFLVNKIRPVDISLVSKDV